jgi:hypothetical protein
MPSAKSRTIAWRYTSGRWIGCVVSAKHAFSEPCRDLMRPRHGQELDWT